MTISALQRVAAAYSEKLFHEVNAPALRVSFANVTDDDAKKIIQGVKENNSVRNAAFKILLNEITPPHMRDDQPSKPRELVLPLDGISASAARGLVQAVNAGLVNHSNWLNIYGVYERIRVTAGDREP